MRLWRFLMRMFGRAATKPKAPREERREKLLPLFL